MPVIIDNYPEQFVNIIRERIRGVESEIKKKQLLKIPKKLSR